jgi:hypothetical protein
MRIHEVGQFYGERQGWVMFDARLLTPAIKTYLLSEAALLGQVMKDSYDTLVEIGCGYARYLTWALQRNFAYVGLEIVPWLVDLAALRLATAKRRYPDAQCTVLLHPAEEIASVLKDLHVLQSSRSAIAIFPFNCLGNVSRVDQVINSLKESNIDVLVSTFKTDAVSTKLRKNYYQECGFKNLNSRVVKRGLLMTSEEGFHALAYHSDYLIESFSKAGFALRAEHDLGAIGVAYHFVAIRPPASEHPLTRTENLAATVYSLHEDPINAESDASATGFLLAFEQMEATCNFVSDTRLGIISTAPLHLDTKVRVVVWLNRSDRYVDFVGLVSACSQSSGDQYQVEVELSKSESTLIERLFGNAEIV